ncbi:60S ribosomal protein L27B [Coemansia sp. RSA 989]|nr:ribosomal L27e protein family-domain-containing protein [Coemansia mojavensis]KAJ1739308.1 60S ribosomal protein L27B [Coemansia sp. RSA 1086]KAJ1747686.1 60S ribosomal protein L27B [Coemansia sp. RSA 1821]KAJ1861780.1 60S ribosomal protein L27B [Coemansia sp. RSA 989]KAJ1869710.1 60S ribosomal protein L27B [Coemansia sp. RSA 990]KAJ2648079.1 60S ribosomal protein L27B [Coemansia sp. RSA 1250]KAJ2675545.1 60S ribosomal protein L27B [Coemansia sp. RSA 1085]
MAKFLRGGKVVILLQGRYAGKKAVIVKNFDEGTPERPYPHAIVAGIERYPLKVTRAMSNKKVAARSRVKPFIKAVNYAHLMPTRYSLELEDIKTAVTADTLQEPSQRAAAKKAVRASLEKRYMAGKNKWFFTKLRF